MLRTASHIDNFHIHARDGIIGKMHSFLFSENTWNIRYFVVESAQWLDREQVLLSPAATVALSDEKSTLLMNVTEDMVSKSPDISAQQPISFEDDIILSEYYSTAAPPGATVGYDPQQVSMVRDEGHESSDLRNVLRSSLEVSGYQVQSSDAQFGTVEDFLIDDKTWEVCYLIIDTSKWFTNSKKVLLSPFWISEICFDTKTIQTNLSEKAIRNAPPYHENMQVDRVYEQKLHDYYNMPVYWKEMK